MNRPRNRKRKHCWTVRVRAKDREQSNRRRIECPVWRNHFRRVETQIDLQNKIGWNRQGGCSIGDIPIQRTIRQFDARKPEKDQGEAFRKLEFSVSQDKKDHVECVFDDVPFGKYVVAAFYDKDSNKRLNANFVGLPSEPYGFSKDARGTLGPPKYEDAEIGFDKEHTQFSFTLK